MAEILMEWRCDYCLIASFPTYEQATQHEATCPFRLNGHRPPAEAPRVINLIEDDAPEHQPVVMSEAEREAFMAHNVGTALNPRPIGRPMGNAAATGHVATMWECDVCQEYKSRDYDEVVAHEKRCGAVNAEDVRKLDEDMMEEADDDSDVEVVEDPMKTPEKPSYKRTKWRCDVCNTAIFDSYNEAVEHEKNCTGEHEKEMTVVAKKKKAKRANKGESSKSPSAEKKNIDDQSDVVQAKRSPKPTAKLMQSKQTVDMSPKKSGESFKSDIDTKKNNDAQTDAVEAKRSPKPTTKLMESKQTMVMSPKKTASPATNKSPAAAASRRKSPKKNQSSSEAQLVDSLAIKTSEMPVKTNTVTNESDVPQSIIDGNKNDKTMQSSMEEISESQEPEKQSIVKSSLSIITKTVILLAPLALTVAYLPKDFFNSLLFSMAHPSYTIVAASTPFLLIVLCYTTFSLALAITHQGVHHHTSRGFALDILIALRDTVVPPKIDYVNWEEEEEKQQPPTLREYLNHKDGFSMAFCPAFFGFFAYFGALTALEEETNGRIVPKLDNNTECGLKSVAGASAGAMAAVMLAAGIQPRVAAEYVCKFNWGMVADPPGLGGLVKGNKFEGFMRTFIKEAAARADGKDGDVMLEDALVPVAVSGFDLFRMRGTILKNGCMAKAARCSAGFPGLFQPVSWNADDGKKLIIDGGIRDGLGLNGLSAFPSKSSRVINLAVGDFGMSGSNGLKDLPNGVEADSLVSIAIVNTPHAGPWAMSNGPKAVESARKAMVAMLDTPMERGTSKSHFVLRVDASKFISA